MTNYFIFAFLGMMMVSCTIDRDKEVKREKFLFKTGDDTEIFFKNIRASYYDKEEKKETRWEIYRHKDLYKEFDSLGLKIAIILNVLHDEAYIMVEPGDALQQQDEIVVHTLDPEATVYDSIVFDHPNKEGMLEFASQLYEAIRNNEKLYLITASYDTIPVLKQPDRRNAFRKTMADYYRLVRVF